MKYNLSCAVSSSVSLGYYNIVAPFSLIYDSFIDFSITLITKDNYVTTVHP